MPYAARTGADPAGAALRPGVLMLVHVLAARRDGLLHGAFMALVLVCLFVLGVLAWYFGRGERLRRMLRRTPVRRISAVRAGERVRVIGTARAQGETLKAPLTGRPCLYYCAEVWARRRKSWRMTIRKVRGVPFLVDDGSGVALVNPNRADVLLGTVASNRSGAFDNASPAEARFLAQHGEQSTGLIFNRSFRYSEAIIEVGERVAVLGAPRHEPDRSAGAPVELSGSLEVRLVICDAPATTRG